jgi:hypothetical protein
MQRASVSLTNANRGGVNPINVLSHALLSGYDSANNAVLNEISIVNRGYQEVHSAELTFSVAVRVLGGYGYLWENYWKGPTTLYGRSLWTALDSEGAQINSGMQQFARLLEGEDDVPPGS